MKRAVLFVLVFIMITSIAQADVLANLPLKDYYDEGLEYFYIEEYDLAAKYFKSAGNLLDSKKWAYYCEAIQSIMQDTLSASELRDAQARFELLAEQSFRDAEQWVKYCVGRDLENEGYIPQAAERYGSILVHDSIERYFACEGKPNLLEKESDVRSRRLSNDSTMSYYDAGEDAYFHEDYQQAADYFCLAGNFEDARKWRCYCMAISLIENNDDVENAYAIFKLLRNLGFSNAADWCIYCTARDYEDYKSYDKALNEYKKIFLHDSSERYLKLRKIVK